MEKGNFEWVAFYKELPLSEQEEIVKRIEEILGVIDKMK